ncbi:MAG: glycyl-radical enzyme activating protein [Lachnospiraceae bacterium]|nr:glycyl-radical enzyme activating protein [Lachnospiraceae bacterium]
MLSTIVSNIQSYSIHDGPGIRTVVFLKGCPLRCRWCANPENLRNEILLGFIQKLCVNCLRCAKVCPADAIVPGEDVYRIDRERCTGCFACAEACFPGAMTLYGQEMSAEEVFRKVARDRIFYDESGGGITVSGGEPLTQADFAAELFAMCRAEGLNTCIETCGHVDRSRFERVLDLTDLFLFDLKIMDPEKHREWTGADNALILKNAAYLAEAGARICFRKPLIPGINDGPEETALTAEFIRTLNASRTEPIGLELMPYHRIGTVKYEALGLNYPMGELPPLKPADAEPVAEAYRKLDIDCRVSQ